MKTADIQTLVIKSKLMYVVNGKRNKNLYYVKFKEYLSNIRKILTNDITEGQVKVIHYEVLPQDFIVDDQNNATLVYCQTNVELSGDFKRIREQTPDYLNHLVEFMEDWLNNFDIDAPPVKPAKRSGRQVKKK